MTMRSILNAMAVVILSAGLVGARAATDTSRTKGDPGLAIEALMTSFVEEDVEGFVAFLPGTEIPFELSLEAKSRGKDDREIRRSREQIHYLLQDFFSKVEIEDVRFERSTGGAGPNDLHGVLRLLLKDSSSRRLYLHLRRMKGRWKVAELRALP